MMTRRSLLLATAVENPKPIPWQNTETVTQVVSLKMVLSSVSSSFCSAVKPFVSGQYGAQSKGLINDKP